MGTIKDKIKRQAKEERAYKKMLYFGWTPEQASGIVGNLVWESNLDTTVLGTADDKGSRGLAQWHSGRLKTLQNRYGANWTDLDNQLEFVNWELNNTHKKAGDKLRKSKGVYNTGRVVSDDYEIPKDKWVVNEKRQNVVYDIHRKYSGSPLTDQDRADMLKGEAQRAISNYNATQQVTTNNTNFETPQISTNLATVPDSPEKEEVAQAKQEVQQKQNEENFINALYPQQQEEEQVVQQQPKPQAPQANVLERYAQIENFVDEPILAQAQQGGNIEIKPSKIQGKGAFTNNNFKKGDIIGLAHTNEQPSTELGQYHNHSDSPNSENVKVGNERYLYALKPMKKGEEITVDYRKQPELEQPEDFIITEKEKAFLKLMQQYKK